MNTKIKPYMMIIIITLCILVGIYFLWPIIADDSLSMLGTADEEAQLQTLTSETIHRKPVVYITGAVMSPGLYEIDEAATIGDIIQSAGGALPYADLESINMAKPVQAGEHIHVIFNFHGNTELLLRGKKININTASAKELDTLPGIGPTMAKRIEDYRTQKGPFASIETIKEVKGIGDGLYKKIKDKITI